MKISRIKILLICLPILISSISLHAGEQRDYAWLKLQEGINLFHSHQYGDAMVEFRQCRELNRNWPDVEFWIGQIYEVEGDYVLALKQFEKAITLYQGEANFRTDDIFQTYLHLADIYSKTGRSQQFLETLEKLLSNGNQTDRDERTVIYSAVKSALATGGMNKVLELYRIENSWEIEVYHRKSEYFIVEENWLEAETNLIMAVLSSLSAVISEMERIDINFLFTSKENAAETDNGKLAYSGDNTDLNKDLNLLTKNTYSDLSLFLKDVSRNDYIQDYIVESRMIENLYLLADVLYRQSFFSEGNPSKNNESAQQLRQQAIDILWLCIKYPHQPQWSQNANRLFIEISSLD